MTKTILFASTNAGKLAEVREIAAQYGITIVSPDEAAREAKLSPPPDVDETGETYLANARLKAAALFDWSGGMPTLADDTGLEVNALGGEPGVRSARYAGPEHDAGENRARLLRELESVDDRSAGFVCVIVLKRPGGDEQVSEGRLRGLIATEQAGGGGFGYDNIFLVDEHDRTLAELKEERVPIKTHRAIAVEKLFAKLSSGF